MIPSSFIQDLLARTDIADIVGRHVTLKKAGINYKGLCPFHGEKTPSFIVSPSRQTYHCFGCGVHGNALGFLMENGGLNFVEAVRDLAQMQGMPVPDDRANPQEREQAKAQKQKQQSLTDVLTKASDHWRQQLRHSPRAVNYLKGRGLTGEIAARFALGYAPEGWKGLASVFPNYDEPLLVESGLVIVPDDAGQPGEQGQRRYDRFRDRIMFPIRSVQGQIIGFGGRVLDKGEPKYLNSPETPVFSKGRELYGLYEARSALRNKGYVIVTEGYMDVVALAQWGYGNAVATLGTACTPDHVHKLFRFTERVVFSFDGDAAGRRAAGRALEASLPHATDTRRISFLFLPPEHDPDSYIREHGPEAFEACVAKAVPLSRQLLAHALADGDLDSAEGRARLLVEALPMIALLPQGALRGQIADDLATMARCSVDDVRQRLAQLDAKAQAGDGRGHGGHGGPGSPGGQGRSQPGGPDDFGPPDAGYSAEYDDSYGASAQEWDDGAGGEARPRGRWNKGSGRGDWSGKGGKGRWRREGGGWDRQARPARPLPQAIRPLERAAWMLLHRSDLWEQLPPDVHDLLCDQPMPLGALFCWLDRTVAIEGPISHADLLMRAPGSPDHPEVVADEGLTTLLQRLAHLDDMLPKGEAASGSPVQAETLAGLLGLIQPLQLQALNDELELLFQSGELSEQAELRKYELLRLTNALKLEISRQRPISG